MKLIRRFITIFIASFVIITPVSAVSIDTNTLQFYSKNNILYYNPNGSSSGGCVPTGSITVNSSTLPQKTIDKLESSDIKEKAEKNMSRYLYAQEQTGLPWQVIAALHYHEGGQNSDQSALNGNPLGSGVNVDGLYVDSDPNKDAKNAAEHYIQIAKEVYGITSFNSLEDYAYGFLAYNRGYMYKNAGTSFDLSPYVMNYYDENHWDMKWVHADSYNGSQKLNSVEGKTNYQFGTLTIFVYLNGASENTSSTSSTSSVDGSNVTIIGDSITYGSNSEIQSKLPNAEIDAKIGRSFEEGISIAASTELRQNVVFALGSNSSLTKDTIETAINTIGTDKNIYFITNYTTSDGSYSAKVSIYEKNNELLKNASASHNNITIIDWATKIKDGNYLSSDGLHPNADGQTLFAELIYNALNKTTKTVICDEGQNGTQDGAVWDGSVAWYNQCDDQYEGKLFGEGSYPSSAGISVCSSACGVFSMAAILTMSTNTTISPETLMTLVGTKGEKGTDWGVSSGTKGWTSTSTFNIYQEAYPNLHYSQITAGTPYTTFKAQIENALRNGKYIWIVGKDSTGNTPFTSGGHFFVIRGISSDGNWLVIDSNGTKGYENTFNKTFSPQIIWNAWSKSGYGARIVWTE